MVAPVGGVDAEGVASGNVRGSCVAKFDEAGGDVTVVVDLDEGSWIEPVAFSRAVPLVEIAAGDRSLKMGVDAGGKDMAGATVCAAPEPRSGWVCRPLQPAASSIIASNTIGAVRRIKSPYQQSISIENEWAAVDRAAGVGRVLKLVEAGKQHFAQDQ